MFGGKKSSKSCSGASSGGTKPRSNDLAGMLGLGGPMGPDDDGDDDDASYLAELAALEGRPVGAQKKSKPKKALVSMDEIDRMAAAGMKDVDEDMDYDDDDFDESDLIAELEDLASDEEEEEETEKPSKETSNSEIKNLLIERKQMYAKAIGNAKAKEGSTSKVRRFDRGLKEIENLMKKVDKESTVSEDDIPPPVAIMTSKPLDPSTQTLPPPPPPPTSTSPAVPETLIQPITSPPKAAPRPSLQQPPQPSPRPQPSPPKETQTPTTIVNEKLEMLQDRQKQFKVAALERKQEGNIEAAKRYLATSKQFDTVIEALKAGKEIDLSNMPEPPDAQSPMPVTQPDPPKDTASVQTGSVVASGPPPASAASSSNPPSAPTTVMEALQQRLEKYEETAAKAKEEGNGSKARRMGRIVKQYQDAIKAYKAKKLVDLNELPAPPGFGPIPGVSAPSEDADDPPQVAPALANTSAGSTSSNAPAVTRNEKEYEFLLNRQKEFKMAALEAKKSGNLEMAREYLRQSKGLDQMILAAQNGMRVDVTTVPSLKKKTASMKSNTSESGGDECSIKTAVQFEGSMAQKYSQIETALQKQIETSKNNDQHYKLLGNLEAAKNFESLLNSSKKDLNTLLHYKKQGSPVPKCEYMTKTFPVTKSNPQLSDSELEITVVRCVNVPLPSGWQPKDMYIYVTYEFPFPQEKPQTGNTSTKKETINPEYNESFKVSIDRKNRSFGRFCKRQALNVKVYYVKGFLKSDKALGQASIKLEHFSNKCEIHESVDLMDLDKGRKSVGGKIEILLKIREPLVDKDAEIIKEKWLVLDTHLRELEMKTSHHPPPQPSTSATYESLEVLKLEKDLYLKQVGAYKSQGKQPPGSILEKNKICEQKMQSIQAKMKQGGKQGVHDYLTNLTKGLEIEKMKAQIAMEKNDKDTARACLNRRKLIEKEIGILKQRLGV